MTIVTGAEGTKRLRGGNSGPWGRSNSSRCRRNRLVGLRHVLTSSTLIFLRTAPFAAGWRRAQPGRRGRMGNTWRGETVRSRLNVDRLRYRGWKRLMAVWSHGRIWRPFLGRANRPPLCIMILRVIYRTPFLRRQYRRSLKRRPAHHGVVSRNALVHGPPCIFTLESAVHIAGHRRT